MDHTRLLPRSKQERLYCVSLERTVGRGLFEGIQAQDCDGEPLPWGLHGVKGGAELMDGG